MQNRLSTSTAPRLVSKDKALLLSGRVEFERRETRLQLYKTRIIASNLSSEKGVIFDLLLRDVFAVHRMESIEPEPQVSCGFVIYALSQCYAEGLHYSTKRPQATEYKFYCSQETMDLWVRALHSAVFNAPSVGQSRTASAKTITESARYPWLPRRHLLVIINPYSGTKQAGHLFDKYARPIFEKAHLSFDVMCTERANHALEFCRDELDLDYYTGIACVGGDGIVSECLNGIMQRKDWQRAIRIPLAVLPGGTGNGLASSSVGTTTEVAAFHVARGFFAPLDISSVFQPATIGQYRRLYSFLSVSHGFISDIDHGTESFRFLGSMRNDLGGLWCILRRRTYAARLRVVMQKPCNAIAESEGLPRDSHAQRKQMRNTPRSCYSLGAEPLQAAEGDALNCSLLRRHFSELSTALARGGSNASREPEAEAENLKPKPAKVEEESWLKEINDKFVAVIAANVSHMAHNAIISPQARADSSHLDLLCMREGPTISRSKLYSCLTRIVDGTHILHPEIEIMRCRAFALEPIDEGSFMSVDGEQQRYAPVFVELHPSLGNIICSYPNDE